MQETSNKKIYIWGVVIIVVLIVLGFIYFSNSDKEINNNATVGDALNTDTLTSTSTDSIPELPNFDYKG